jgi:hypothetical protein
MPRIEVVQLYCSTLTAALKALKEKHSKPGCFSLKELRGAIDAAKTEIFKPEISRLVFYHNAKCALFTSMLRTHISAFNEERQRAESNALPVGSFAALTDDRAVAVLTARLMLSYDELLKAIAQTIKKFEEFVGAAGSSTRYGEFLEIVKRAYASADRPTNAPSLRALLEADLSIPLAPIAVSPEKRTTLLDGADVQSAVAQVNLIIRLFEGVRDVLLSLSLNPDSQAGIVQAAFRGLEQAPSSLLFCWITHSLPVCLGPGLEGASQVNGGRAERP